VDLVQVGRELGLLEAAGGHIRVRGHDLAPGLEATLRPTLDRRPGCPPPLPSGVLLVAQPQDLLLLLLDLLLWSRNRREQALDAVEGTVGIVGARGLVVCPAVAEILQLVDDIAVGGTELLT
jgi:hypothetical protein